MNQKKCDACGKNCWQKKYGPLIECRHCKLARASKIPSQQYLNNYYQQEYFFGQEYTDYKNDRPSLEKNFRKRLAKIKSYVHKNSINAVEVGSAYGFFLKEFESFFKKSRIQGYDVSADAVHYADKELKVSASTEDFLNHKTKTDVVAMWDVIEHVRNPREILEHTYDILNNDGIVALTTGDIGTFIPKIRKSKWRMIHPPTHLFYFNKNSMRTILENTGFEIVHYSRPIIYRNLGSVLKQISINRTTNNNKHSSLASLLDLLGNKLNNHSFGVNTYDIMFVIAKKSNGNKLKNNKKG